MFPKLLLWEHANKLICISGLNKLGTKQTEAAPIELLSMTALQQFCNKRAKSFMPL